jgi:hypothetical protein
VDLTELTASDIAAEHRRLALESSGTNKPPHLADDAQWSLLVDHWMRQYIGIKDGSHGVEISYRDQLTALRWAYASTESWGNGQTWPRALSGRQGAKVFADKALTFLDKIDRERFQLRETDRHYTRADRAFRANLAARLPGRSQAIADASAAYVDACRRFPEHVRKNPHARVRYEMEIHRLLCNLWQATAIHYRPKGRSGNLGGDSMTTMEKIAMIGARQVVAAMVRGVPYRVPRREQAFHEWILDGCGGEEPPMGGS